MKRITNKLFTLHRFVSTTHDCSPLSLTDEKAALVADAHFFRRKERDSAKVRAQLDATYAGLTEELRRIGLHAGLIAPPGFNPRAHQFVKGEQLEAFPYQCLDYPKHFDGANKFTFRTLFWWGHHVACALILEREGIKQYKKHLVDRFLKIVRFVPMVDPRLQAGLLPELSRETFRSMLPIVTV